MEDSQKSGVRRWQIAGREGCPGRGEAVAEVQLFGKRLLGAGHQLEDSPVDLYVPQQEVDENTHEATLTQSFYEVGQVSKFIQRGAVRIASDRWVQDYSNPDGTYGVTPGLDNVALENPDGSKVLVATNNSETAIHFQVQWRDRAFAYTLGAGATVTFRWR